MQKKTVKKIALILVVIGGLNWGLIGFFGFDPVAWVFGFWPVLVSIVYELVGLSALFLVFNRPKI